MKIIGVLLAAALALGGCATNQPIHSEYNRWIGNLDKAIRSYVQNAGG